jgi:hypothetical protein
MKKATRGCPAQCHHEENNGFQTIAYYTYTPLWRSMDSKPLRIVRTHHSLGRHGSMVEGLFLFFFFFSFFFFTWHKSINKIFDRTLIAAHPRRLCRRCWHSSRHSCIAAACAIHVAIAPHHYPIASWYWWHRLVIRLHRRTSSPRHSGRHFLSKKPSSPTLKKEEKKTKARFLCLRDMSVSVCVYNSS